MRMRDFLKLHPIASAMLMVDLAVIAVVVAIAISVGVSNGAKSAVADILVAPVEATIKINGEIYEAGTYKIEPGSAKIEIAADGFETKNLELNFVDGMTTRVHDFLEPMGDNLNYYSKNEGDFDILKRINTDEAERLVKIISIRDELPMTYFKYGGLDGNSSEVTINEDMECSKVYCLLSIGDTDKNHQITNSMIKEKGYNPDDYEIRYK